MPYNISNKLKFLIVMLNAFIVCGGKGKRFPELSMGVIPKSLIPLNEKPLISYQIKYLNDLGVTNFTLSFNYKWQINLFKVFIENKLIRSLNYKFTLHKYGLDHYMDHIKFGYNNLNKSNDFLYTQGDVYFTKYWITQLIKLYKRHKTTIITKAKPTKNNRPRISTNNREITYIDYSHKSTWTPGQTLIFSKKDIPELITTINESNNRSTSFIRKCLAKNSKILTFEIPRSDYFNINTKSIYNKLDVKLFSENE